MTTQNNPVLQTLIDQKKEVENELRKGFSDLEMMTRGSVPEVIFIRDFLPAFSGEIVMSNELLSIWYSISGGPFNQVNVVDSKGKLVAIVPPVMDRDLVSTQPREGNVNQIVEEHEAMMKVSPMAANNKLIIALNERYSQENKPADSELTLKWKKLLSQFNKIPEKETINKVNNQSDYEMEYE